MGFRTLTLSLVLAAAPVGCKAAAVKPAGFVISSRMTKQEDLPFHTAWRHPACDFTKYKRIYVAPVDTKHLRKMSLWEKGETGVVSEFNKDIKEIAVYLRKTVRGMYEKPPKDIKSHFTVTDNRKGRDTLVLELAVVEVVPSKVTLEALTWLMPLGTGILLSPLNTSTAAMEGRFVDGRTGAVLLSFADREGEQARPIDLAGFTWYSHAKGIMKDWAKQLVQVANQKPGEVIKDTKVFTLEPW